MFYSIDLNGLRFLHKDETFEVVAGLVHIEASDCDAMITSFDSPGSLSGFTIFELKKLYANTTGKTLDTFEEAKARTAIYAVAQQLPITNCVASEVIRQMSAIAFKDEGKYQYVKGSNRPATRFGTLAHMTVCPDGREPVYGPDVPLIGETMNEGSKPNIIPKPDREMKPKIQNGKPIEGVALEIWNLIETRPDLRDGMKIQAEARQRGWNTLTAIVQLSNWKKFNLEN